DGDTEVSVAVIVTGWAVVELVIVAVYVPSPTSFTLPIFSPGSLDVKLTVSPGTGLAPASVTVAFAVAVDFPSATIDAGESSTPTFAAGPWPAGVTANRRVFHWASLKPSGAARYMLLFHTTP